MSTNCVHCIVNQRTGNDLLCDECRGASWDPGGPDCPSSCSGRRIGDFGQRYEVRCMNADKVEITVGWSNIYPHNILFGIDAHPSLSDGRVIERSPVDRAKSRRTSNETATR